jgi:hypothetical protein
MSLKYIPVQIWRSARGIVPFGAPFPHEVETHLDVACVDRSHVAARFFLSVSSLFCIRLPDELGKFTLFIDANEW